MTFKEAKDILKKEFAVIGLHKSTEPFEFDDSNWFGYEKPSVLEAFRVLSKEGYYVTISGHDYNMRENRLKKEYEENTKAPNPAKNRIKGNFPGNKSIEYCGDSMPGPGEEQPKEGNPALEEAASQFNDALLNEQAKEIERLKNENEDWKSWYEMQSSQIAISNIAFRNEKNRFGKEIARLNKVIHKKNEDLRLTKIREKNLAELGLKYVGENEKLKKELADKVVDKIDAQALKSAESALAWKEKVVTYKDMALAYYKKKIAEKDEVIADLGNELAATKKELAAIKESYKRRIKEDSEHFEHIQKICNAGLQKWLIESEYLEKDKPFCFPQLPDSSDEEEKKPSLFRDDSVGAVTNQKDCSPVKDTHPTEDNPEEVESDEILERVRKALEKGHTVSINYDKAEEGADQSATIVECGKDIDDVFEETNAYGRSKQ